MSIAEFFAGKVTTCPECGVEVERLQYSESLTQTLAIPCNHMVWYGEPPPGWPHKAAVPPLVEETQIDEADFLVERTFQMPADYVDPIVHVEEPEPPAVEPTPVHKSKAKK